MNRGISSEMANYLKEFAKKRYPSIEAVVLVGSQVRGNATSYSDFDLICLGASPKYELAISDVGIVAFHCGTKEWHHDLMLEPSKCAQVVPAWREAVILFDSTGEAASLKDEASRWDWETVGETVENWVAGSVVGFGEEVMKMLAALENGEMVMARVQASLLAIHLTPLMETAARRTYLSENDLWCNSFRNPDWYELLARAIGAMDIAPSRSCKAALQMYANAIDVAQGWMDAEQRRVCDFILKRIEAFK